MGALCCAQMSCSATILPCRPELVEPVTKEGNAGDMIMATDERIHFVGRGVTSGSELSFSHTSALIRFRVVGPAQQVGISLYSPDNGTRAKKMRGASGSLHGEKGVIG
jgi:hypothetical protein